jgi:hypothetical protein
MPCKCPNPWALLYTYFYEVGAAAGSRKMASKITLDELLLPLDNMKLALDL